MKPNKTLHAVAHEEQFLFVYVESVFFFVASAHCQTPKRINHGSVFPV